MQGWCTGLCREREKIKSKVNECFASLYFQQVQTLLLTLHISWELHSLNVMSACGFPLPIPKPAWMSVVCWLLVLSSCVAAWCPVPKVNFFFLGDIPGIDRTFQGSFGLSFLSEGATLIRLSACKEHCQLVLTLNSLLPVTLMCWAASWRKNDFRGCCSEKLIKIADFCVSLLFNTWYLACE